jgi:hypothetical protein
VWLAVVVLAGLTVIYAIQTNSPSQAAATTFTVDVQETSGTVDEAFLRLEDLDLGATDEVSVSLSADVSCAAGVSETSVILDFPTGFTIEGDDAERSPLAVQTVPCQGGTAYASASARTDVGRVFQTLESGQWYFVLELFDNTNPYFEDRSDNLTITMTFADASDMHAQDLFDAPKYPRASYLEWSDEGLVQSSGTLVSPHAAQRGRLWDELLLLLMGAIGGLLVNELWVSTVRRRRSNAAEHERRPPRARGGLEYDGSDSQGIA